MEWLSLRYGKVCSRLKCFSHGSQDNGKAAESGSDSAHPHSPNTASLDSGSGASGQCYRPKPPRDPISNGQLAADLGGPIYEQPRLHGTRTVGDEMCNLRSEVEQLRLELARSKRTINKLQQREQTLKDRLSDQARKQLERGSAKFEDLSLGEQRPSQLIRRYNTLYTQGRLDALDALDKLPELENSDDLKSKLVFSVIVLAFRSVRSTIEQKKGQLKHLLGLPNFAANGPQDPTIRDMLESVGQYMRKTVDKYDMRSNLQEVCSQLYTTLYDFPSLRLCRGLTVYTEESVRLAWALSNQIPAYVVEYEVPTYDPAIHERFHTSNQYSQTIQSYLWPALLEGDGGPCVCKAIVIT